MRWGLKEMADVVNGHCHENVTITGVSNDSRKVTKGDLYIAISGDNFDGHQFVDQAASSGATAALVEKNIDSVLPLLQVDNTIHAMGQLAREWREKVNPFVIAVTASNGKTTLKEMLAKVLQQSASVLYTQGNLNNEIGVPMTLLRLQNEACAVVELGANHMGEIEYLSNMVLPDIALLANAGRAHIEGFGSEENIAKAKAEIVKGLKEDGLFVINQDSQWEELWRELASDKRVVSFGQHQSSGYRLIHDSVKYVYDKQNATITFDVQFEGNVHTFSLRLLGLHNIFNAVAVIAVCRSMNVTVEDIYNGLLSMSPVKGRLFSLDGFANSVLIDDSYNANPDSVIAAIDVLKRFDGYKVLIIGDLAELGNDQVMLHRQLGIYAKNEGIDQLWSCGKLSQSCAEGFGDLARHFADHNELICFAKKHISKDYLILVKGSRSSRMDVVVDALSGGKTQ